jgi:hypothetical protein
MLKGFFIFGVSFNSVSKINSERALSLSMPSVIMQFVQVCQRLFFYSCFNRIAHLEKIPKIWCDLNLGNLPDRYKIGILGYLPGRFLPCWQTRNNTALILF